MYSSAIKKKNTDYRIEVGPNASGNSDSLVGGDAQLQQLPFRARLVLGLLAARLTGERDKEIETALDRADSDPEGTHHYEAEMGTGAVTRVLNNGTTHEVSTYPPPTDAATTVTDPADPVQPHYLAAPEQGSAETLKPW